MILVDTQVVIWLVEGNERLGKRALATIESGEGKVHVSAISFLEMAMLVEKRRLVLPLPLSRWKELALAGGLETVPVNADIALEAGSLPGEIHGDPADRIMIATARSLACPLVTADRGILAYAGQGHLQVIDARR